MDSVAYRLFYWPEIPGRGEFVRLAFEASSTPYEEVVREWNELSVPMWQLEGRPLSRPPLAPPFLEFEGEVIAQTAHILEFIGPRLGLVPDEPAGRRWVNQLQLTIMDWALEVHDTHHPISPGLYYEDQKSEALRRAGEYLRDRQPMYLEYFEGLLHRSSGPYLLGEALSYADLSLFFMLEGLEFAFPSTMDAARDSIPRLAALRSAVADRPAVQAYWESDRRRPFSDGLFRYYPELDALGS